MAQLGSSRSCSALSSSSSRATTRESTVLAGELLAGQQPPQPRAPVRSTKQVSRQDLRERLGRTSTAEELGHATSPSWTSASAWSPSHPLSRTWTTPGGFLREGQSLGGGPALATQKDVICVKAKGGVGAPYAAREGRPVAGFDVADAGGQYKSYHSMMAHRVKHVRTANGPNQRFTAFPGPPITSWDNGFVSQKVKPPRYPLSTTTISKSHEEILKTTGGSKGR